jgi:hypothetical protein
VAEATSRLAPIRIQHAAPSFVGVGLPDVQAQVQYSSGAPGSRVAAASVNQLRSSAMTSRG